MDQSLFSCILWRQILQTDAGLQLLVVVVDFSVSVDILEASVRALK